MEKRNDAGRQAPERGMVPEHGTVSKRDAARAGRAGVRSGKVRAADVLGAAAEREDRHERRTSRRALAESLRKESEKRRGKRKWMATFLVMMEHTANVRLACYAACITRQAAYELRAKDEAFREAWDTAIETASDRLEEEAWRRAYDGVDRYMISYGRPVLDEEGRPMFERHYSDMLLDRLLRAHRPQKYRDNPGQSEVQTVVKVYSGFDPDTV